MAKGGIKYKRVVQNEELRRYWERLPEVAIKELTTKQLKIVLHVVEAAYVDGYQSGGGDMYDELPHLDRHGRHARLLIEMESPLPQSRAINRAA